MPIVAEREEGMLKVFSAFSERGKMELCKANSRNETFCYLMLLEAFKRDDRNSLFWGEEFYLLFKKPPSFPDPPMLSIFMYFGKIYLWIGKIRVRLLFHH